jgi:hypothetical protein
VLPVYKGAAISTIYTSFNQSQDSRPVEISILVMSWTMSDMVKYKGSEIIKDQRAALYFTMSDLVHWLKEM